MPKVRVNGSYALWDAETQQHVAPRPDDYFDTSDSLVKQHRWAFSTDEELAAAGGPVEAATAVPGEKRRTAPRKK